MGTKIRLQLSTMMFFQFFVWGTWYVTMGTYLFKVGFSGIEIGAAYSTINWGAIVSPFFVGIIADRFFSAQKVMAAIHLTGAVILFYLANITDPSIFFWTLLLYSLLYMPTLALANAICFHQMESPEKEFPSVRVLGTIGWIAAGLLLGFLQLEDANTQFIMGAGSSVLLGLYALSLPDTPPKGKKNRPTIGDILGLDAAVMFKDRSFVIFTISALLISIPLAFYYSFTNPFFNEMGLENAAGKMTLGQVSEIVFLLLMPLFFVRLGVKKMILVGMIAWAVRYVLFVYGNSEELVWMYYLGIILHGVCYDFFFVTGQIYVDNAAPKHLQASAQGLITLLTYGLGMLIGSWTSGWYVDLNTLEDGSHDWTIIWWMPAIMAVVVTLLFMQFFHDNKNPSAT
ncbi:MAG: nucleoside permease [Saprospiraceae bacterium]|jgi:nucleoside transporter